MRGFPDAEGSESEFRGAPDLGSPNSHQTSNIAVSCGAALIGVAFAPIQQPDLYQGTNGAQSCYPFATLLAHGAWQVPTMTSQCQ